MHLISIIFRCDSLKEFLKLPFNNWCLKLFCTSAHVNFSITYTCSEKDDFVLVKLLLPLSVLRTGWIVWNEKIACSHIGIHKYWKEECDDFVNAFKESVFSTQERLDLKGVLS